MGAIIENDESNSRTGCTTSSRMLEGLYTYIYIFFYSELLNHLNFLRVVVLCVSSSFCSVPVI